METLPDVGQHFRALRKQAGKSQMEVAMAVGMRQEALSRFESGHAADFSLSKLLRLLPRETSEPQQNSKRKSRAGRRSELSFRPCKS